MNREAFIVLKRNGETPSYPNARLTAIRRIQEKLDKAGLTLRQAIAQRDLYFRVSILGNCNLSCQFCHNEGAPQKGMMDLSLAERAIEAAVRVGFLRLQFTGGEPLLRRDIGEFVTAARKYVSDVGITTNGTFLTRSLDELVDANLTRLHVSLQEAALVSAGSSRRWGVPEWLEPTIQKAGHGLFSLRLNLPVPYNRLQEAEDFLRLLVCDVKVFSVLPEGNSREDDYPLDLLEELVGRINRERQAKGVEGRVFLRGYRPPQGIRCPSCSERARCKEQSHSLRLGADRILRPCLASREWDSMFLDYESIWQAALLSLDYFW